MSKYLDDKLFNICYRHIYMKYNGADLNDDQLKEVTNLKKLYISKSSEYIKENGHEIFKGIPTQKEFEKALYQIAIDILAKDIVEHNI